MGSLLCRGFCSAGNDGGDVMAAVKITCGHCGKRSEKRACDVARARKAGLNIYCNRRCAGLARRCGKTKAQRAVEKAAYDRKYRAKNLAAIKAKKSIYFKKTYDPVAAAVVRKRNMPRHIAYCRRPEYRAWKTVYDKQHRAKKFFGAFAEVAMLTNDLNRAIKERMTNAEIRWQNKTANKTQFRDWESKGEKRTDARPRQRAGSDDHRASHG
jgi:hypothetical protein